MICPVAIMSACARREFVNKAVVFIGKESVGKSQLIRSLTGRRAVSEKLKGSTIYVQSYETEHFRFIDTPGILMNSDSISNRMALDEIPNQPCVGLVISGTSIDKDLQDMLPFVKGKLGVVFITHWDKVKTSISESVLRKVLYKY
jgi:ferrous iron transport protein B